MLPTQIPRYRQLTATLRASIVSGEYPVGTLLPTEIEISRNFGVSRHTVRDALRILSGAGLIQRRRRVGTIVMAQTESAEFVQPLPGFDEVLQYGREVRLIVESYDSPFDCALTTDLDLAPEDWIRINGRRGPEDRLIGLATIVIRRDCAPPKSALSVPETTLSALIEKSSNITVGRIDQEISAVAIDRIAARNLKSTSGAPALRARRLYYEKQGNLFLATESIHPGDRFSYKLNFNRNEPDEL